MEFEEIDNVLGETLSKGDIVCFTGDFHQIKSEADEDLTASLVTFSTYNLSTGDEDDVIFGMDDSVTIFRSF